MAATQTTGTPTAADAGVETWTLDPTHTHVEFAVKHMMMATVKGRFSGLEGEVRLSDADPASSSVEVRIDTRTIDTRVEQRDAHLRSADFLDVETYPEIVFRSRRVEPTGERTFRVVGDLTIRDVTREVVLEAREEGRGRDPWGGERAGFSASTRIKRGDYGLKWNQALETGGVLVGEEVRISVEAELVRG